MGREKKEGGPNTGIERGGVLTDPERHLARVPCLLNPHAKRAAGVADAVRADARFRLFECTPEEIPELVRIEVEKGARRIVVAGGDGTIAAAAGCLAESDVELAVLPGGTFNHFARSHGIPTDPLQAVRLAAGGTSQQVDIGYVNDRVYLNTSSVGVYVSFVHTRQKWQPRVGYWLASAWAAFRLFARLPIYSISLEMDGETRHYRSPLIFVGIGERNLKFPKFGERVPGGSTGLHVMVIRNTARARTFAMLLAASARGTHAATRTPHLEAFLVERCTIELPGSNVEIGLDGETLRLPMPLRYRLARESLRLVKPGAGGGEAGEDRHPASLPG